VPSLLCFAMPAGSSSQMTAIGLLDPAKLPVVGSESMIFPCDAMDKFVRRQRRVTELVRLMWGWIGNGILAASPRRWIRLWNPMGVALP
jgi:hypothetical protein